MRNSIWSLAGRLLPLLAGILIIPFLLEALGLERFAILSLLWLYVAYLTGLDFGVSKGVVKYGAELIADQDLGALRSITATGFLLNTASGVFLAILLWVLAPVIVESVMKVSPEYEAEVIRAFQFTALLIPIALLQAILFSLLAANQRFASTSLFQTLNGLLHNLVPLLAWFWIPDLAVVMAMMLVGKMILFMIQTLWMVKNKFILIRGSETSDRTSSLFSGEIARKLLGFGGWVTVSNIISSAFDQIDRYVIAALISVSVLAYYSTPIDVLMRVSILPTALIAVLFPAISTLNKTTPKLAFQYTRRTSQLLFLIFFPLFSVIVLFAEELLTLWLGADFALQSASVAQLLAIGFLFKYLSYMPVTYMYGTGLPGKVAKAHFLELVFYIILFPWATIEYGLTGAAVVFTTRLVLEHFYFSWLTFKEFGESGRWHGAVGLTLLFLLGSIWIDHLHFFGNWPAMALLLLLWVGFARLFELKEVGDFIRQVRSRADNQ